MILETEQVGKGRQISFIHGFTQTSQSWKLMLAKFKTAFQSLLIDAPGHGHSPDGRRNLNEVAHDLVETISPGPLVGYSMGARMSLHAALLQSPKISHLVLISGTPGISDDTQRQQRLSNDIRLAQRIIEIDTPSFVREWLEQPLFSDLEFSEDEFQDRCRNTAQGLADSLLHAGTGTQLPLWNQLHTLEIPVLIIAGEKDLKYVEIAHQMKDQIPNSNLHVIANAGHAVHSEKPRQVALVIEDWLLNT